MIRAATADDIAAIVTMARALAVETRQPVEVETARATATMALLIGSGQAHAEVVEIDGRLRGFLVASLCEAPLFSGAVAIEHGWYCNAPGWGARLLDRYLRWASDRGARFIRLSTAAEPGRVGKLLRSRGFRAAEQAWVRGS